jgi:hypothetical protein
VNTLQPWQWGAIVILAALVLTAICDVAARLWATRHQEPWRPVYDWQRDDGWLDVLARDHEGEVLTVIPADWNYR